MALCRSREKEPDVRCWGLLTFIYTGSFGQHERNPIKIGVGVLTKPWSAWSMLTISMLTKLSMLTKEWSARLLLDISYLIHADQTPPCISEW
jgi:hypothetical protein